MMKEGDTKFKQAIEQFRKSEAQSSSVLSAQDISSSNQEEILSLLRAQTEHLKQISGWMMFFGITLAVSLVVGGISFVWLNAHVL